MAIGNGDDMDAARLRQLSDEAGKIASSLSEMSLRGDIARNDPAFSSPPQVTAGQVRDIIRARRARRKYLSAELFADPAWDILLVLLERDLRGLRTNVSFACAHAAVPATTALRWLSGLTAQGLVQRYPHPTDQRVFLVSLADETKAALHRFFADPDVRAVI